jgi:hypothetical protein
MTATRKATCAALVAGVVAITGLTACSSKNSDSPSLYSKWGDKVTQQVDDMRQDCVSTIISQNCINDVEALQTSLTAIRADAKAAKPGTYTDLLASLDSADAAHDKFVSTGCEMVTISDECLFDMKNFDADIGQALHQMGS